MFPIQAQKIGTYYNFILWVNFVLLYRTEDDEDDEDDLYEIDDDPYERMESVHPPLSPLSAILSSRKFYVSPLSAPLGNFTFL